MKSFLKKKKREVKRGGIKITRLSTVEHSYRPDLAIINQVKIFYISYNSVKKKKNKYFVHLLDKIEERGD